MQIRSLPILCVMVGGVHKVDISAAAYVDTKDYKQYETEYVICYAKKTITSIKT